jgi:hypothetical protein
MQNSNSSDGLNLNLSDLLKKKMLQLEEIKKKGDSNEKPAEVDHTTNSKSVDNTARMGLNLDIKSFDLLPKENENLTEYLFEKQKDEGMFEHVAGQSVSDISPMAKSSARLNDSTKLEQEEEKVPVDSPNAGIDDVTEDMNDMTDH